LSFDCRLSVTWGEPHNWLKMQSLSQILSYLLPVLYLAIVYVYYLIFSGRKKNITSKTTLMLVALLVVHILEIMSRHMVLKTIPLSTIHDSFGFLAFSIVFVYLNIELSVKNRGSGLFILSFALILEVIATINLSWTPETNELLSNPFFAIHASLSIMGYTAFSLSAIYALMYILQNYNLKKRNLGKMFHQLPAITYLEKMSIRSVAIGIILLGIGILLGHFQALKVIGEFWPKDIKVIVSDAVCLIYLVGYFVFRKMNWRGERMAYFTIAGFLVLIIGGFLVIYLSESFHEFY